MATGVLSVPVTQVNDLSELNLKFEGELGIGGTSDVLLGRYVHTNKRRALKVIQKTDADGGKNDRVFHREIAILGQLDHRFIISDILAFSLPEHYVISMPYCDGGDLFDRLLTLTPLLTNKFFFQLLSAVKHMHDNRIAHRDIKPENILLTSHDTLKLCDFGMATKASGKKGRARGVCGTPGFMAPEILKKQPYDMFKTDVYAMGVTLWRMLFPQERIPDDFHLDSLLSDQRISFAHGVFLYLMLDPNVAARADTVFLTQYIFKLKQFKHYFYILS